MQKFFQINNTNSSSNNVYMGSGIVICSLSSFTSSHCTFSNNKVSHSICHSSILGQEQYQCHIQTLFITLAQLCMELYLSVEDSHYISYNFLTRTTFWKGKFDFRFWK